MTLPPAVANLITARRIEQVPADRPSTLVRLIRAEEKLDAARKIAAIVIGRADLTADLAHAEAIIKAVRNAF